MKTLFRAISAFAAVLFLSLIPLKLKADGPLQDPMHVQPAHSIHLQQEGPDYSHLAIWCGNGVRDGDEQCDDGNTVDFDGCSSDCKMSYSFSYCGNGVLNTEEACDDGNHDNGDGCSETCSREIKFQQDHNYQVNPNNPPNDPGNPQIPQGPQVDPNPQIPLDPDFPEELPDSNNESALEESMASGKISSSSIVNHDTQGSQYEDIQSGACSLSRVSVAISLGHLGIFFLPMVLLKFRRLARLKETK